MAGIVVGSPIEAFADAILQALVDDAVFSALVGGRVKAALPETTGTVKPYVIGERRELPPGPGAMQTEGYRPALWLDFWSDKNGPHEVSVIMARARAVLMTGDRTLELGAAYRMVGGSLLCEEELVIPDFDPALPQKRLFHGVQKWVAIAHEAA